VKTTKTELHVTQISCIGNIFTTTTMRHRTKHGEK